MKTISRYIMTLALLITAVGGAWAQTQWESGDCTVTLNNGTLTVSGNGAMANYQSSSDRPWDGNSGDITSVVVESGVTTVGSYVFNSFENLTSVTLPEGLTAIGPTAFMSCCSLQSITIPSTVTSIDLDAFMSCTDVTDVNLYADPANLTWNEGDCDDFKEDGSTQCHVFAEHLTAYQTKFNGKVNVTFVGDLQPLATSDVEVTTNKAEGETTFTEATFTMPPFDATAEYELVRDMSVQMTAKMGDGTDGLRYRVKKSEQGEGYEPADMTMMQVLALVAVNDGIEQKALTPNQDYYCLIYKLDEQTKQPEGDGVELVDFDFAPGLYALKAFANVGSNYDGETALSNTFKLFQGYEITVPAGEYATFYKDENICTDDENAELYTITEVNATEAVLSDAATIMPKNTPMLIFNKGTEDKTFLLIPTTENADAVTYADQFQGTTTAQNLPASSEDKDYYVCTGNAFVWVKSAGTIAANRCWLEIVAQHAGTRANTRSIVSGGDTTNIDATTRDALEGDYYDLQGRKVEKPLRKGIYIKNGKKVIKH